MHLKRDTEYAMRILVCMALRLSKAEGGQGGIPYAELSMKTKIPKAMFDRVCDILENHKIIIREVQDNGELWLFPGANFLNQSFLSLAEAVEGNMRIFIFFDRDSCLTEKYGKELSEIQARLESLLSGITIEGIMKKERQEKEAPR